jgi:hypothetical protein
MTQWLSRLRGQYLKTTLQLLSKKAQEESGNAMRFVLAGELPIMFTGDACSSFSAAIVSIAQHQKDFYG